MLRSTWAVPLLFAFFATDLHAQRPPYDVFPPADPPYYRVRYEASAQTGELAYPVTYTLWIPKGVKPLRGVIVHQHGCGEGSCKSGLTGAYDLHWQALAKKHGCALLAPSYEQPDKADCQMWCDPRNGSRAAFRKCLVDLGAKSGHAELPRIPWALWGHSGGGHWAGGMVLLHPERVAAAWLRSGVPLLKEDPKRATIKAHTVPDAALKVPVMCNLGTQEGVTVKDGRFAGVWPANEAFFNEVRGRGGFIGVAVDPLSSHDCGNQRYLAIPWLDACLSARLPPVPSSPQRKGNGEGVASPRAMPTDQAWLGPITGGEAVPAAKFAGDPLKAAWLPNEAIARAWMQYVKDTAVTDVTPPPAPMNLRSPHPLPLSPGARGGGGEGTELIWEAEADLESGLASFIIERDGRFLAKVPEQGKNPFGRPIFQNLQYSDTPTQPLVQMRYTDKQAKPGAAHTYRVSAVNTVGLKSTPSADLKLQISSTGPDEANFRKPRDVADLRYWLENMVWHHNFTKAEIAAATGLSARAIDAALIKFNINAATKPRRPAKAPLLVLPYPGGRHPRIGFLDGAIRPQRETKISVFTPWDDASYVVVDVPEAIFSNLGLTYLAHTHVPTIWEKQGIDLEKLEWNRRTDGMLDIERMLPNGIVFGASIVPMTTAVRMELWLANGTKNKLTDMRVQNCVLLKGAKGFATLSNANKVFAPPYAACRSADGKRWVITAWEPHQRSWANAKCPCLHSDPRIPDCDPGDTQRLRGWLSFYGGDDLQAELRRIDRTDWRAQARGFVRPQ